MADPQIAQWFQTVDKVLQTKYYLFETILLLLMILYYYY